MKMFDQTSFPDILMSFFQTDVGLQMWLPLSKITSLQYKNDDLSFCGTLRMPTQLENGPLISDFRGSVIYFTKPNLAFRYNDLESIGPGHFCIRRSYSAPSFRKERLTNGTLPLNNSDGHHGNLSVETHIRISALWGRSIEGRITQTTPEPRKYLKHKNSEAANNFRWGWKNPVPCKNNQLSITKQISLLCFDCNCSHIQSCEIFQHDEFTATPPPDPRRVRADLNTNMNQSARTFERSLQRNLPEKYMCTQIVKIEKLGREAFDRITWTY